MSANVPLSPCTLPFRSGPPSIAPPSLAASQILPARSLQPSFLKHPTSTPFFSTKTSRSLLPNDETGNDDIPHAAPLTCVLPAIRFAELLEEMFPRAVPEAVFVDHMSDVRAATTTSLSVPYPPHNQGEFHHVVAPGADVAPPRRSSTRTGITPRRALTLSAHAATSSAAPSPSTSTP